MRHVRNTRNRREKMTKKIHFNKKKLSVLLAISMMSAAGSCFAAFAEQSPSFAYSSKVWAKLRDNKLEYDEIDKLIHEYNPTVLSNALSYKDQSDKTSSDVAQSYYDAAEQIQNNMSYPDEDSANYASGVTSYLNSQISYENLREQGDKNTNDSETYKLNYDKQEANLCKQAKQLMVNYWSQYNNLETYRNNVTLAEQELDTVSRKLAAGLATESSKLSAEQSLTKAKTALQSAEVSLESTRKSLVLMLGWNITDEVEIGELPIVNADTVNTIDLNSDIEKAKSSNYTLKTTERQLSNATTSNVKEELTQTKDTAVKNIAQNVTNLYDSLKQSISDLDAAKDNVTAKEQELSAAEHKKAAGMMTESSYKKAELALDSAKVQQELKQYAVLTAYINYEAAVNGLAET